MLLRGGCGIDADTASLHAWLGTTRLLDVHQTLGAVGQTRSNGQGLDGMQVLVIAMRPFRIRERPRLEVSRGYGG